MSQEHHPLHSKAPELEAIPQRLEDQNAEIFLEAVRQVNALRRDGTMPLGILDLPTLSIGPEMTLEERLGTVGENQKIFYEVLHDHRLKGSIAPKKPQLLEWDQDEDHRLRSVITRLTPDLTLMENMYIDNKGNPYHLRPQLWASQDMIAEFLREHKEDLR